MRLEHHPLGFVCLAALIIGAAAGSFYSARSATHRRVPDDAWRRTASGWERARDWQPKPIKHVSAVAFENDVSDARRWDTHPAALALAQVIGVLSILKFVPRRNPTQSKAWHQVPAVIARSYRASFFGS